jgi:hypothetical protein
MTKQTIVSAGPLKLISPDIIIALTLAVIMLVAFIQTLSWPSAAAMFPRVVALCGLGFAIALGVILIARRVRAGAADSHPGAQYSAPAVHDQPDDQDQDDVEYIFATAGKSAWKQALGWVALFLALTTALGLFVSSGIFALLYLRWGAGKPWRFSTIYAITLSIFLLAMFRWILYIPTPVGMLTGW